MLPVKNMYHITPLVPGAEKGVGHDRKRRQSDDESGRTATPTFPHHRLGPYDYKTSAPTRTIAFIIFDPFRPTSSNYKWSGALRVVSRGAGGGLNSKA